MNLKAFECLCGGLHSKEDMDYYECRDFVERNVELSDVVPWLEEHHGAIKRQAWVVDDLDPFITVDEPGTYLVVRVSDD